MHRPLTSHPNQPSTTGWLLLLLLLLWLRRVFIRAPQDGGGRCEL
jgi:MYXO-CTERM domain-containing protein